MKRRHFIKAGTLLGVPFLLKGIPVTSMVQPQFSLLTKNSGDKILVLIQLNGGNDGLNTIFPKDQYGYLANLRSNIIIPENTIISLTDTVGIHPVMSELAEKFKEGQLAIVQDVAYPNQNRSHFRSTDIWNTGSAANEFVQSGWMGRYLETQHPDYPEGYPNSDHTDPIALTIGSQISETCQGTHVNYSIAINGEDSLSYVGGVGGGDYGDTWYGREVDFLASVIHQLNTYSTVVKDAFDKGKNSADYGSDSLSDQMKLIARLISGGLQTKVYIANIGGFDTHANQVSINNPTEGNHANSLRQISEAISSFMDDLDKQGLESNVAGMTYSEFGRRIRSNGSRGTDHGTSAPMFIFGNCARGGVIGDNTDLSGDISESDGVSMQYDFRSVYGSLLVDWFGASEEEVRSLLYEDFSYVPLLNGCNHNKPNDDVFTPTTISLHVFPNPTTDVVNIDFKDFNGNIRIEVMDRRGNVVYQYNMLNSDALGIFKINASRFKMGMYYIHVSNASMKGTAMFIKT